MGREIVITHMGWNAELQKQRNLDILGSEWQGVNISYIKKEKHVVDFFYIVWRYVTVIGLIHVKQSIIR